MSVFKAANKISNTLFAALLCGYFTTLMIYMFLYLPCSNMAAMVVVDICYSVGFNVACYTHRVVVCSS